MRSSKSSTTAASRCRCDRSPNALPIAEAPAADVGERWLDLALFDNPPLLPALSGLGLEYRIVQLYCRNAGPHTATLLFKATEENARQPRPNARVQDVNGWASASIDFECLPSHPVTFHVTTQMASPEWLHL